MFKILGADGKEYGPVTVDQLKQWVVEGRANHETMAQKAGDFGWKPLAQYADFSNLFPAQPPAFPAPPVGAASAAAVGAAPSGARARALELVKGPAIALIVTAIMGISYHVFVLATHARSGGMVMPMYGANPEMLRMMRTFSGPATIALSSIAILVGVFILVSALKMQKLAGHGLAMAASIVAMIPCLSPCCLLGLPFGIWALVVLSKPEVRSQFDL